MENQLLTTKEVAAKLGVTDARVRAMILAGRLPAQSFGRAHMIKESDLALVSDRKAGRPKKEGAAEKVQVEAIPTPAPTKKTPATMTAAQKKAIADEQKQRWLNGAPGKKAKKASRKGTTK